MAESTFSKAAQPRPFPPLREVKPLVCCDTVEALENLLLGAKSGEVTGIAFAVSLRGRRYVTDVTGFLFESPTFARGALSCLNDELAGLVHGRDPSEPR